MTKHLRKFIWQPIIIFLLALPQALPASATSFCYVKKSPDGFVALRKQPRVSSPMVGRMKQDDEVMIGLGLKGNWMEVTWWHGDDRLTKGFNKRAGHGWVNSKYIENECG